LHAVNGFTNAAIVNSRFESNAFYGEQANGIWTLRFLDFCAASATVTALSTTHPLFSIRLDINLVVIGDRPEEHIRAAIKRVLQDFLGKPNRWGWEEIKLAALNAAKPSRVSRVTYEVPSIIEAGRTLTIVVEANVTERTPHLPVMKLSFSTPFRGDLLSATINSFDIHELMGTKMRALFQRKRGRDLFDRYWAITAPSAEPVEPKRIIESFTYYMAREGTTAPRDEFLHQFDH
jgi:hypothetical protein